MSAHNAQRVPSRHRPQVAGEQLGPGDDGGRPVLIGRSEPTTTRSASSFGSTAASRARPLLEPHHGVDCDELPDGPRQRALSASGSSATKDVPCQPRSLASRNWKRPTASTSRTMPCASWNRPSSAAFGGHVVHDQPPCLHALGGVHRVLARSLARGGWPNASAGRRRGPG